MFPLLMSTFLYYYFFPLLEKVTSYQISVKRDTEMYVWRARGHKLVNLEEVGELTGRRVVFDIVVCPFQN